MSPEQRATAATLASTRRGLARAREALSRAAGHLSGLSPRLAASPTFETAAAAFYLQGWYTACEGALELIARQLDGEVPDGDKWHRDLLAQLATPIPSLRPAVLTGSLETELGELLKTRSFLRHGSAFEELDERQILTAVERLLRIAPEVVAALAGFDRFLADAAAALGEI